MQQAIRRKLISAGGDVLGVCSSAVAIFDPVDSGKLKLESFCIPGPTYHELDEAKQRAVASPRDDLGELKDVKHCYATVTCSTAQQDPKASGIGPISVKKCFGSLSSAIKFVQKKLSDEQKAAYVSIDSQWAIRYTAEDGTRSKLFWVSIMDFYAQSPEDSFNSHLLRGE